MARVAIVRAGRGGIREVDLVFERIVEKPAKVAGEWINVAVSGEEYALYRESGPFPKKIYLSREESEELLGLISTELNLSIRFDRP
jgi:hypothetical protein